MAPLLHFLKLVDGDGAFRVERQNLQQCFFFFGVVTRHRAEPQPGIFVARIRHQHQIEEFARFFVLAAFGEGNALS